MKIISWNVNGFRAVMGKGFPEIFDELDADIFCLQETKLQPEQVEFKPEGYHAYWFSAEKKGYSGTAVLTKSEPLSVCYGIDGEYVDEGRVITCEYPDFYLVCAYVPNAQDGLKRLGYRMDFEDAMRGYLLKLDAAKPVVYCGDLNVAHNEIDIKNPAANTQNPGFSAGERGKMTELLSSGFADTFRSLHPDTVCYSWWSYRFSSRAKNIGWRLDYHIVSDRIIKDVTRAEILTDIYGSDHCPVLLEM